MDWMLTLAIASFLLSLLLVGGMQARLNQNWLDLPNHRSAHTRPTPRGGGLGFILAILPTSLMAAAVTGTPALIDCLTLWVILVPLVIVGAVDDRRGVPAALRFLVQFLVARLLVTYLGPPPVALPTALATLLTAIAIVALINFYNFMDGSDGLVAGVTAVQLAFLALWFSQPHLWLLVLALLGFLYWNWSPAKIFMGDVGSTFLGAVVAIALLQPSTAPLRLASALVILLPLVADAVLTLLQRLLRGENIFQAHRQHLYQRLQKLGWSHRQIAIAYLGLTLGVGLSLTCLGAIGMGLSCLLVGLSWIVGEVYVRDRWRSTPPH